MNKLKELKHFLKQKPNKDTTSSNMAKFFHGTHKPAARMIEREGLKPVNDLPQEFQKMSKMSTQTDPSKTYFFKDKSDAAVWSDVISKTTGFPPAVIQVDVPKKMVTRDLNMPYGESYSYHGIIPKNKVKVLRDEESKDMAIRFGRRPRDYDKDEWSKYQETMNKLTHKETPFDEQTKMNTILHEDKEIRRLEKVNPFWRRPDMASKGEPTWHQKYNTEAYTALKDQGYNEDETTSYLAKKNLLREDAADIISKQPGFRFLKGDTQKPGNDINPQDEERLRQTIMKHDEANKIIKLRRVQNINKDEESKDMPFVKKTTVPVVDYPTEYNSYTEKKTVKMHPIEFLKKAKLDHINMNIQRGQFDEADKISNMPLEEYNKTWRQEPKINRIKKGLNEGKNIPGLYLDQDEKGYIRGHEGRHRAITALELGIKEIPVHLMTQRKLIPSKGTIGHWDMSKKVNVIDTIPGEYEGEPSDPSSDEESKDKWKIDYDSWTTPPLRRKLKLVNPQNLEFTESPEDKSRWNIENIKESGEIKTPIEVWNKYTPEQKLQVRDGHHRVIAAQERGDKLIPAIIIDKPSDRTYYREKLRKDLEDDEESNNSQIYLNPKVKEKDYVNKKTGKPHIGMFTLPRIHTKKIFINRLPITSDAPGDAELLSSIISHEEIHQELNKHLDYPTSTKYDKISNRVDTHPKLDTTSIPRSEIMEEIGNEEE